MPSVPDTLPPLIGEARCFVEMLEHVSRLAPLDKPVLVIGERGTGKELIAARLHYLSRRWDRPFVKLNCAALSDDLLESELFGHEAGAFTGAVRRHQGRFERADTGTLFLDEIANASLRVQEKILRVIEYGEFERVGGGTPLHTDVRVIGATNVDLPARAAEGKFRADLLDRLAFDVVTQPPLRARREDIPLLAEHFALAMAHELGRDRFAGFAEPALAQLLAHDWPGNVRELRNAVERAVYQAEPPGRPVERIELDPFRSPYRPRDAAAPKPTGPSAESPAPPPAPVPAASAAAAPAPAALPGEPFDLVAQVRQYESDLLLAALRANRFNQKRTAAYLGLTYHQLRGYLRKHNLPGAATDGQTGRTEFSVS